MKMVFLQKIAEKAAEVESLAQKLSDEKKINKDLSVAATKLQKLLETTHKQLQKEKEKNAKAEQVRSRPAWPALTLVHTGQHLCSTLFVYNVYAQRIWTT